MTPDWSKNPQGVSYADFEDPQTLNLYSYVRDNPTSRFDENGHAGDCITQNCYAEMQQGAANSAKKEELAGNSNNQPAQQQNNIPCSRVRALLADGHGRVNGQLVAVPGLMRRREAEYGLYANGVYDDNQ